MNKDELYMQLIKIAEEKSAILSLVEYDPEIARKNPRYTELEQIEREYLLQIKRIEDDEIIENSFLFAYDYSVEEKTKRMYC